MRTAPDFTLKQLAYLRVVVNAGSFSSAAAAANVSQPALSLQIRTLEDHFGGQLVERRRDGLVLTTLGDAVLARAHNILNLAEELSTLVVRAHQAPVGPVRLGLIPTVAPYLLPRILPNLRSAFPDIEFAIREGKTGMLMADLEVNAIDAAVTALPTVEGMVECVPMFEEPFVLAVGPDFKAPRGKSVAVADLDKHDILLLEEGHCLRDQTIQACGINVARALNRFGATSLSTIVEMVASGYGVTLLPEMSLEKEAADTRIRLFSLRSPCPTREVGLVWRASSPYADFYGRMADAMISAP
ncbi:MAG: LysR substrate-binding domain-containing protein [Hyphomicrobiaceae bacterium]